MNKNNGDYKQGYLDGMNDKIIETGAHAYFAGVGYGKKEAGEKHLGFADHEHLESFNRGVRDKDKHFISVKKEMGFFEKLFDFKGRKQRRVLKNASRIHKGRKNRKKLIEWYGKKKRNAKRHITYKASKLQKRYDIKNSRRGLKKR